MTHNQVYIELGFKGRLLKSSNPFQVEIDILKSLIEEFGLDAVTSVPGYCSGVEIDRDARGQERWTRFWMKTRSAWAFLVLEERAPGVFVLHDRDPRDVKAK
ncbi:MAG TPA: hypothetical protein VF662_13920 [Allosphingosinicella sp.]|jgi:hypothetical protein